MHTVFAYTVTVIKYLSNINIYDLPLFRFVKCPFGEKTCIYN